MGRELDYIYDLLYDIKTEEQLKTEVEHLANRLAGIMSLCRDDGRPIDEYVSAILRGNAMQMQTNSQTHAMPMLENSEHIEVITNLVQQYASHPPGSIDDPTLYDSFAISAMADAMRYLAKHGVFEITYEKGRRVLGHFCCRSGD